MGAILVPAYVPTAVPGYHSYHMLHNTNMGRMYVCTHVASYFYIIHRCTCSCSGDWSDLTKTTKLVNLAFNLAATQSKQHNGHTVVQVKGGNHIPTYQIATGHCSLKNAPSLGIFDTYVRASEQACLCVCVCVCVCTSLNYNNYDIITSMGGWSVGHSHTNSLAINSGHGIRLHLW